MASHHEQKASKCYGEQQHWPAYNPKLAPPQASTEGLFQHTRLLAIVTSVMPPKMPGTGILSETAWLRQLSAWHFRKCHSCEAPIVGLGASYVCEVHEQRSGDFRFGSSRALHALCVRS